MNRLPPGKIFKSYDIRGVYPDELNEDNAVVITKAIFEFLTRDYKEDRPFKIAVGRDMRLSTPAIFKAVSETLVNLGAEVIDLGLVATPTFYFAVFYFSFDGGIQITASHNPGNYNGLKIVKSSPEGLIKVGKSTGMEEVKALATAQKSQESRVKSQGRLEQKLGVVKDEVENALAITGNPEIKPFKIVADTANAMAALYIEELFKQVPGELIKMNFELDGTFPAHPADPFDFKNLADLQKRVVEEKADLGLAPDGDGDRMFFVDEQGQILPAAIITALVAREMLRKHPGEKILFDIRYIMTPKKIVEECGGKWGITKVGHAFITEVMSKTGAIFGGESSAHYFFRETGNAESQVPIVLAVLEVMSRENKKLSEIVEELRRSFESGEINFKKENSQEILEKLKAKYHDGDLSELDGIAISYPEWRFSVRTSNTEPLLRLNVEALDKQLVEGKKQELVTLINSY